jgi:hypothetical protein
MTKNTQDQTDAVVQFDGKNVTWKTREQAERDRAFLMQPSPCPHCGAMVDRVAASTESGSAESASQESSDPTRSPIQYCPACGKPLAPESADA